MVEEDTEFITFDGDSITKSQFRDEIIELYQSANIDGLTKITDFTIGSEAYHLADVMATFILEHRELVDLNYRMSMIHYAEGEFLDNFGDMNGVHRVGSSPSEGVVTFTRLSEDTSDPITIADGTQVSTIDAISFIVDNDGENVVIPSGSTTATAEVLCELEGAYTNVDAGAITLVMGDVGSLVSVTNSAAMTGGVDIEEDDDYRARILLSPYEFPVGTLGWFENLILSNEVTSDFIHDVYCIKGETVGDADVTIIYNPKDWDDTSSAGDSLEELFAMKEYDVVGITMDFVLADKVTVLDTTDGDYRIGVLLESNYTLSMVKDDIINVVNSFNSDAMIGVECMPSILASRIENEVDGVLICKLVSVEESTYTELVEQIDVESNEVYEVDTTDLEDRIELINFNLVLDVEEET